MRLSAISTVTVLAVILAGCSLPGSDSERIPELLQFKNTGKPDDLATTVAKPLEFPDISGPLPRPTRSGENRADPKPEEDVIRTLGGEPTRGGAAPPDSDTIAVAYVSRFGSDPGILQTLEAEDLEFRRKNDGRFLERAFKVNVYAQAYRSQAIDPYAELERLRIAGVRTPSAPPNPAAQ